WPVVRCRRSDSVLREAAVAAGHRRADHRDRFPGRHPAGATRGPEGSHRRPAVRVTGPIDRPTPHDGHDRHDRIDNSETRGAAEMNEQELGPEHPPQSTGSKYGTDAYRPADEYGTVVERPAQLGRLRTLTIVSLVLYVLSSVAAAIIAMDE